MSDQPEALRLAEALGLSYAHLTAVPEINHQAAAELRRLSAIEDEWARLSQDEGKAEREIERLRAMNQELREALGWIAVVNAMDYEYQRKARAALVKAEGQA